MVKKIGGKARKGGEVVRPRLNGAQLFKRQYWSEQGRKGKHNTIQDADKEVRDAWHKLSKEEKSKYSQKAKDDRDHVGCPSSTKERELQTRSSLKQFVEFAQFVRSDERLMAKAKEIGFHKILEVTCTKIPHALCGQLVRAIDPPSSSIRIRNLRRPITETDVQHLLGLPNEGCDIIEEGDRKCQKFENLKEKLGKKRFSDLKEMIISRKEDDMFEPYLVLYTLGTLLCPPKNGGVSHRLLKIISCEKTSFGGYNWCKFVINELMKEVTEYKKALNEGVRSKYVGGCIYFVMILFLQNFPLLPKDLPSAEHALEYWNDANIKEAVKVEDKSNEGILFSRVASSPDDIGSNDYTLQLPQVTMFKEPKTRQMYCRIMRNVGKSVAAELLKMEKEFEQHSRRDGEVSVNIIVDEKKSDNNEDNKSINHVQVQVDGLQASNGNDKGKVKADNISVEQESDSSAIKPVEVYQYEGENDGPDEHFEVTVPLRRSQRVIRPAIHSPFLSEIGKAGRPNEKERLYAYCIRRTNPIVGQEIYVEIDQFFLRKSELSCLNRRGWISECVVTLIGNVLVAAQKSSPGGHVRRHILQPIFMDRMLGDIDNWKVENHARFIDPQKLGYNISDCDYVFAPVVRDHHWFCYVFVKDDCTVYLLDSLLPNCNTPAGAAALNAKRDIGHKVSQHFCQLLSHLNHNLYGHKPYFDFRFGLIPQQNNGWDCGMYVISWLQSWENIRKPEWDGFTMPNEDMDQKRVDIVWWLLTHEKNKHKDTILKAIEVWHATKKKIK